MVLFRRIQVFTLLRLIPCDEVYYAATVFDRCNTLATKGNTEHMKVCDEIYESFMVFESCNTW
jgi:hypothetical protein